MPGGGEAHGLHLAEDVLRDQLLDVDGRLDLGEAPAGGHELVRAAGADLDELLADEPLVLIETMASVWSFTASSIRRATRAW